MKIQKQLIRLLGVFSLGAIMFFFNNCQQKGFQSSENQIKNVDNYYKIDIKNMSEIETDKLVDSLVSINADNIQILPESEVIFYIPNKNITDLHSLTNNKFALKNYSKTNPVSKINPSRKYPVMPIEKIQELNKKIPMSETEVQNLISNITQNSTSQYKNKLAHKIESKLNQKIGSSPSNPNLLQEFGPKIDLSLSKYFPPIADQGNFNSCVGQSLGYYGWSYLNAKNSNLDLHTNPSKSNLCNPLFVYFLGNHGNDNGMSFDQAIEAISYHGCGTYSTFSKNFDQKFDDPNSYRVSPPYEAFLEGVQKRIHKEPYIGNLNSWSKINLIRGYLSEGRLVSVAISIGDGIDLYSHYNSNGVIIDNPGPFRGSHAVTMVGYDDNKEYVDSQHISHKGAFLLVNSWGAEWGFANSTNSTAPNDKGYFWAGYDLLANESGIKLNANYALSSFDPSPKYLVEAKNITKNSKLQKSNTNVFASYNLSSSGFNEKESLRIPIDLTSIVNTTPYGKLTYIETNTTSSSSTAAILTDLSKAYQFSKVDNTSWLWKLNGTSDTTYDTSLPSVDSFNASAYEINAGERVQFSWETSNASSVKAVINNQETMDLTSIGLDVSNLFYELRSSLSVNLIAYNNQGKASNPYNLIVKVNGSVCNIESYQQASCTSAKPLYGGKTQDGKNATYRAICKYKDKFYRCDGGTSWTEVSGF